MTQTELTPKETSTGKWKPYPAYKDSGVEWLGEIPEYWEMKRLRFICQINPSKTELSYLPMDTQVSFLPMEHIGEDGSTSLEEIRTIEQVKQGYTCFRNRDVIVAKITPCFENGKGALCNQLFNGIGFGTTELHVLRAKEETDPNFIFYLTRSEPFKEIGTAMMYGSAGQKRVPEDFISNFQVSFPPITEQHSIATFLDRETAKMNTLIAKKERLIKLLQEKRTALISHAVTKGLDSKVPMKDSGVEWLGEIPEHWEVKKIKRLCQVKRGASPRPIDDSIYFDDEGEYAWVRISDVSASNKYLLKTEQKLSILGEGKSVCLNPGELFVSIAGTVGKPIITQIKCCIHDGFVYFTGLKQSREYFFYVFSGGELYKGLGKLGTQLNLNTDTIGDIRIPLPPETEQYAIAAFIDHKTAKIDALISKIREGIEKLKEYSTALISAAVTGKIDVREENACSD